MEDSIIKKTGRAMKKHKKKAITTFSMAGLITVLQLVNVLGPMVCSLPFVKDSASCIETTNRAGDAAKKLHQLDDLKLDDGSPIMVEEFIPDGGDL